ncbi:pyridoxal phosphate-dependent aminotransferase [Salibacterium aidingense]|uniref:pyridoxal phosphate-dependent aminotransferase n=1 Tax=Salibacterium aidingense TaxID=384933 RepID=UPI0005507221|nr:aminotransferase class I/II-fold pyridoxal phosphate-dependent enzyme [Salibacterium aidingense]
MKKSLSVLTKSIPRSGIREIMSLSSGMEGVIHLEVGEPGTDIPPHVREAAKQAINDGYSYYSPNAGLPTLREAVSRHLETYNISAGNDEIIITPGAVTGLALALKSIVDSGEEVLIPDPGWPNYEQMILSQGAVIIRYPIRASNQFIPDIGEIKERITERTKALIINSPSNPAGSVLEKEKLKEIVALAERYGIYIISDEVYDGIIFDKKHVSPSSIDTTGKVVSIFSFSKNYAMTGWRLGYTVASKDITALISKMMEPTVSCASSITQKAGEAALGGPQDFVREMRTTYKRRRDLASTFLKRQAGIAHEVPHGSFYMLVNMKNKEIDGESLAKHLLKTKKVAVAPGSTFGKTIPGFVRLSLAAKEEEIETGVKRLIDYYDTYCNKTKR